jgi:hypothetical protein
MRCVLCAVCTCVKAGVRELRVAAVEQGRDVASVAARSLMSVHATQIKIPKHTHFRNYQPTKPFNHSLTTLANSLRPVDVNRPNSPGWRAMGRCSCPPQLPYPPVDPS